MWPLETWRGEDTYAMRSTMIVRANEAGLALVCALWVIALLATLGGALALVATAEVRVGMNHREAQQAFYAADAGVERALGELRGRASWQLTPAPGGESLSADFNDGSLAPRLPDGRPLDLARLTAERQAESDAFYPAGADRPIWQLFAHTPLDRLVGDAIAAPPYVVVWVADDVEDGDGDAGQDSNGVLMVRAEAFAVRGARRAVQATIRRVTALDGAGPPGAIRSDVAIVAWLDAR